jgi:hypothetical protein
MTTGFKVQKSLFVFNSQPEIHISVIIYKPRAFYRIGFFNHCVDHLQCYTQNKIEQTRSPLNATKIFFNDLMNVQRIGLLHS